MLTRFLAAVILCWVLPAAAQELPNTRMGIFDLRLGTSVDAMPGWEEFMAYACGSNGGPPLLRLSGWEEYEKCPPDALTGLHEVYFEYDDELEYIARARDFPMEIGRWSGTTVFGHVVMVSALFNDEGILAGVRIITDPRADKIVTDVRVQIEGRLEAHDIRANFIRIYDFNFDQHCVDVPPEAGESPYGGQFIKQHCTRIDQANNREVQMRTHFFRKPGQTYRNPFLRSQVTEGQFESFGWLQIVMLNQAGTAAID